MFDPRPDDYPARFRAMLAERCAELVISGLRLQQRRHEGWAAKAREHAKDRRARPDVYYDPADVVRSLWVGGEKRTTTREDRIEIDQAEQEASARKDDAKASVLARLVARIERDGLPLEVMTFDPAKAAA
jgi:hypothetical protein